jgi:hypothetical protein
MSAAGIDQTLAYLQKVRQARHVYRGDPAILHENLKRLSDLRATPEVADVKSDFAEKVADSLDGGFLRYSKRTQLLRQAALLGISRFEANLIIALEEHRAGTGWTPDRERARRTFPTTWVTFILIQLVIVGAIWWTLFA